MADNVYTFSLQQVLVAAWNGDGSYGTAITGESTKTLTVTVNEVSDKAMGNAIITAVAGQITECTLAIDTAGFDDTVLEVLYGVAAASSGNGTNEDIDNTVRLPYFGLIAQAYPETGTGDVLHFFPKCKLTKDTTYSLDYGKIVIPKFGAEAIGDSTLSNLIWRKRTRTVVGAITFPLSA